MKITVSSLLKGAMIFALVFSVNDLHAQKKKKKKGDEPKTEAPSKDAPKKIKDLIKNCASYEGLFTIYQDSTSGATKLLIKKDQLDKEFIYFSQIADGPVQAQAFRGNYRGSKIIEIKKYFNKIEFIEKNTSSYFDPENAISKAAEANMPNAILATVKIEGVNDDETEFLIDGDQLFLKEVFSQVKPTANPKAPPFTFKYGQLDKERTKYNSVRSYPLNTDFAVEYVYHNPDPLNGGSRAVTDARNVSIKVYHSLIAIPESDYTPLFEDPRVGYFTNQVTDMTTAIQPNYRDLVERWHLVKKDPNADLSEPIEPIVWWMENTTPKDLRPIIKRGAEKWNIAFEAAGFKNAVVIKQQADDAEWDAGDIRYNVLRWTASATPPFGGYGPSFSNPRTGQKIGADIMFEYASVLNQLGGQYFYDENKMFDALSQLDELHHEEYNCNFVHEMMYENSLGALVGKFIDEDNMTNSVLLQEFLEYLVMHELGHTMGLNHNMKASQLHNNEDIHNREITEKVGLVGSVMDYPGINLNPDRKNQGQYFTLRPGPYDIWAIRFAYEQGRTEEETKKLLDRSTEHQLIFGNDADDMRSPGKAMDPRVNVRDMTSDAIQYSIDRLELVDQLADEMLEKYDIEGNSHHYYYIGYNVLLNQYFNFARTASRYVGGVYIDRAMVGQPGATKPNIPVELGKQKEAMSAMTNHLFAPDAMNFADGLYSYIAPQRRGFGFFGGAPDPKPHGQVLSIQKHAIDHLLHANTLNRIINSSLYGNEYDISTMMKELTDAIFKADINSNVNSFRQNLQIAYIEKLLSIVKGESSKKYMPVAQSHAIYFLKQIRKMASGTTGNISTKAHKQHLTTLIDNALKEVK